MWAWPSFLGTQTDAEAPGGAGVTITDEWCRANHDTPDVIIQAHSTPLGITFFNHPGEYPEGCSGGLDASYDGDAFVAYHGYVSLTHGRKITNRVANLLRPPVHNHNHPAPRLLS